MARIHMPDVKQLAAQLGTLVGRTCRISESAAPHRFEANAHTARYCTRDDRLGAICQVDLSLAAFLGAALALVPAGGAEEAVKEGELGHNLRDAYSEIANIMAALLCDDGAPHMRWVGIHTALDDLGDDAKAIVDSPCERIDVVVEVEGYGAGRLSLLSGSLD